LNGWWKLILHFHQPQKFTNDLELLYFLNVFKVLQFLTTQISQIFGTITFIRSSEVRVVFSAFGGEHKLCTSLARKVPYHVKTLLPFKLHCIVGAIASCKKIALNLRIDALKSQFCH